ncbi:helix-turn-helix transcriptional regulator [Sphingomonas sp. LR61]|uniref:helix-turn-helix transcriptional regulator n=1 Tax=Sphingomonas sp. LR61 TaxID=3050234 RepID=UPI003FA6C9C0
MARRGPRPRPDRAARHRRGLRDRCDPCVPAARSLALDRGRRRSGARTRPPGARLRARARPRTHRHTGDRRGGGLSPRGLQQSLRRHLDQTPGDLLREVRLDGARADLLGGARDETSVAEIARSWGFGHLGRFSATYRARFGELPSESLRTR